MARTYWRWRLTSEPFEIYRPASSAVGMYQITDAAFSEARRYCIHYHTVVIDGAWHEWRSCWFNSLYMRVVPTFEAPQGKHAWLTENIFFGILADQPIAPALTDPVLVTG